MGKGPAGARGASSPEVGLEADPSRAASAKDRALGLLAVRWRSREELRRRLGRAGYPPEEVEGALGDLEAVGLVNDERFARALVRDRSRRRLEGAMVIKASLRERGVDPGVAEAALEEAGDETSRALELAAARAARLAGLSPETARRRLYGLLLRRGYAPGVAREAVAAVLPRGDEDPAPGGDDDPASAPADD